MRHEDFGEGYGRVPQDVLDYFHELEEEIYQNNYMAKQKDIKTIDCLAIEMTSTHCKGVIYSLTEAEAKAGIEAKLFEAVQLIPPIEPPVE
jgi:hypothetical protein